jgi:hypothetical protein
VNLPPPVRSAIDAANAGDTDAFLAAFTPDGVVDDWGTAQVGGSGFNGPSQFTFTVDGERVSRMTIRA